MRRLARAYGPALTTIFVSAAALWAVLLIVLPQFNMLDMALRTPLRQQDSSIAQTVMRDAQTCQTVLDGYREAPADDDGGLPSSSIMATPSPGLAVPSPGGGGGSGLPYIIQCDRATTAQRLVRDADETAYLNTEYDIETLSVDLDADLETQYGDEAPPRPPYWGGYRVIPAVYEFWQGGLHRLHDRLRYTRRDDGTWDLVRLSP